MGTVHYSVWIRELPEDVWRVYVDPSRLDASRHSLRATSGPSAEH